MYVEVLNHSLGNKAGVFKFFSIVDTFCQLREYSEIINNIQLCVMCIVSTYLNLSMMNYCPSILKDFSCADLEGSGV